mmetsp:Transcript_53662/g.111967  ORF Transcript_53662/g.111967 Transcript_53662/m.111967 type:complete len:132 (-) Transcript_53662:124-519(-)
MRPPPAPPLPAPPAGAGARAGPCAAKPPPQATTPPALPSPQAGDRGGCARPSDIAPTDPIRSSDNTTNITAVLLELETERKRRLRAENLCRGLKAAFKSKKLLHADAIKADELVPPAQAAGVKQAVHSPRT